MEFIPRKSKASPPPTASEASFRSGPAAPWLTLRTWVVGALMRLRTGSVSARSNTVCCWHSHKHVSDVPSVALISVLMSPTIYWFISNLLPTNMQMSDKHRFCASVIDKPLSYPPPCVCVCSCIRDFIIFRSKLCAFLCFNKREFSDYYILNIYIYIYFSPQFQIHLSDFFFA